MQGRIDLYRSGVEHIFYENAPSFVKLIYVSRPLPSLLLKDVEKKEVSVIKVLKDSVELYHVREDPSCTLFKRVASIRDPELADDVASKLRSIRDPLSFYELWDFIKRKVLEKEAEQDRNLF